GHDYHFASTVLICRRRSSMHLARIAQWKWPRSTGRRQWGTRYIVTRREVERGLWADERHRPVPQTRLDVGTPSYAGYCPLYRGLHSRQLHATWWADHARTESLIDLCDGEDET